MEDERFYVALSEKGYPTPLHHGLPRVHIFPDKCPGHAHQGPGPPAPPQARLEKLPTLHANPGLLTAPQLGWSLLTPGSLKGESHLLSGVSMKLKGWPHPQPPSILEASILSPLGSSKRPSLCFCGSLRHPCSRSSPNTGLILCILKVCPHP